MQRYLLQIPLAVGLALLSGCVSVSRRDGAQNIETLLAQRTPATFQWHIDPAAKAAIEQRVAELRAAPLTTTGAVQIAWLRNPQILAEYARLGIAQADIVEASRLGNPSVSASSLKDGGPSKLTTGLSVPLADLLLLPARKRFAAGEYERAQLSIAAALSTLATDVERDWYTVAGAEQVAAMREAIAKAAAVSAQLAQRYHAAGNISALELSLEQAGAAQARIAAARAQADALRARLALNSRIGLSGVDTQWTLDVPLATPVETEDRLESLQAMAREKRLDLAAAQREVALLGDALGLARRWRLLGRVDIGVERERDGDGSTLTGPTLALALPIFNQGQAAIARAAAQQEIAQAHLAQLQVQIDNEVRLGVERVAAMRGIAETYAQALVPQREAVVQGQVERANYMLIGTFELLLAKQQEYDAYQGYLEAVRDYWLARVDLAQAIGTRLPSDAQIRDRTRGVDAILAPPPAAMHHGDHGQEAKKSAPPASDSPPEKQPAPAEDSSPPEHHHHHRPTAQLANCASLSGVPA